MQHFEYKVIPAPKRGEKARGVKTTEERFAYALTQLMNDLGADGWEYQRADTLPCDERVGLTGSRTTYQNMLVFRRTKQQRVAEALSDANVAPVPVHRPADPLAAGLTLGPAKVSQGVAPAVGPAKHNVAAE